MNIGIIKNICASNKPTLLVKCSLIFMRRFLYLSADTKNKSKLSNCYIESRCLLERKAKFGCGPPCLKYCTLFHSEVTSLDFLPPVFLFHSILSMYTTTSLYVLCQVLTAISQVHTQK